ncbi:MAG TPA: type II toxin-antitoxin system Phd/YefM family antitoxin [Burkholderiales bacterium]|nr:type II toxin-antitoxin system Phd/YefM family antitoxin [Burkholderiales bacterium]
MRSWSVRNAKARFREFLEKCLTDGPQKVTKRRVGVAVLVPADEWRRLEVPARPTLKELLLSNQARTDRLTPVRGPARGRAPRAIR